MSVLLTSVCLIMAAGILLGQEGRGGIPQTPARETADADKGPGDPTRGEAVFEGKGACLTCHRVKDHGSRFGPDLTAISTLRTRDALEKSLLDPSPEVQPQDRFYRVVTRDGATFTGKLLNQDTSSVQILDSRERLLGFRKANLREYNFVLTSPMPSYRNKLSSDELSDLIAYLASLKGVSK
jgi:cytochrome c oxidase cbb3-type subunit 3